MTYSVELSKAAEDEALEAYLWMRERSLTSAEKWFNGLITAINSLEENPKRCALAPESEAFGTEIRQLLYGKGRQVYRILFEIREQTVFILHIRHGAMDVLRPEDEERENGRE